MQLGGGPVPVQNRTSIHARQENDHQKGATERDLSPGERFDFIVCSHVIEHVADPVGVLATLSGHLSDGGLMYVEVPPSSGQMLLAVMAVGKRGATSPLPSSSQVSSSQVSSSKALAQAKGFLSPGYREKLRRYRAMPSTIPAALAYKARRLLRRT
uniref:Methyltransferase domain-containing protein n=1 Tax=Candidatus Kentrum sp. FM TaxID=2126340 RepID=A0A450W0N3_9GAMM|nr:MAG: Methyltransferase domain-containing protein [Candidatus Kentron sp. FM]VFJ71901.1 MAG: Methyltransferase domain-containing protein [Candidatus Kentron sp. FM]VFK10579.1 MAG: Methyltransferase domain-containing protein [Candidatus Kentron sp. FM]